MIDTTLTTGILTIFLSGRVDTSNAADIDREIEAKLAALTTDTIEVIIDCKGLSYISSTGLRIVLKYKKRIEKMHVINVSNDIYNVFEMTGFTNIMTVERAMRKVNLEACTLLAQGGNGAVYRINDEEIVKVQLLANTDQMMHDEKRRSKEAFVLGVPTAISFDIVDCGDGRHGAVYEALNSDTLGRYVSAHPEQLNECATMYANLLMRLHNTDAIGSQFGNIKDLYLSRYNMAGEYFTPEEKAILVSLIDMIPDRSTLVHGDPHTNNVLTSNDGELMFIDMPEMDMGHPVFDFSAISLAMVITMQSDRCKGISGIGKEIIPQFLSIAFARILRITDADELKQLFPRLVSLAFLKQTMVLCLDKPSINQVRPILMDMLRKRFFCNIEQVRKDIQWFVEKV